jgi:hypothetical protein
MSYGYTGAAPWMSYAEGGGMGATSSYYPSPQQRLPPNDNDTNNNNKGQSQSPSRVSGAMTNNSSHPAPYSTTHGTTSDSDRRTDGHASALSNNQQQQQQQQQLPNLKHMHTAEELDRLKAAAVIELGLSEVKPIQSDFHFFVHKYKYKLLPLAIAEVDKKLEGKSTEFVQKHRTFLIHSNLNCRIMKAWEDLPRVEREEYFKAEEDDRQRFMEEDEVVSRHCFTLTARIRSPSKSKSPQQFADNDDDDDDNDNNNDDDDGNEEMVDRDDGDDKNNRENSGSRIHDTPEGKRQPEDSTLLKEESPSKKNKAEDSAALEEHRKDSTDTVTAKKDVGDVI